MTTKTTTRPIAELVAAQQAKADTEALNLEVLRRLESAEHDLAAVVADRDRAHDDLVEITRAIAEKRTELQTVTEQAARQRALVLMLCQQEGDLLDAFRAYTPAPLQAAREHDADRRRQAVSA